MHAILFRSLTDVRSRTPLAPCSIPSLSLRRTVRIPPGNDGCALFFPPSVASDREHVLDLADKYRGATIFERTLTLAWTQAQIQLHHLGIGVEEAHLFQRLANAVICTRTLPASVLGFAQPKHRWIAQDCGPAESPETCRLWWCESMKMDDVEIVRQFSRAHEYWRMKQLFADLVIINEKPSSYAQELQGSLDELVHGSRLAACSNTDHVRGSIFSVACRP